MADQSSIKSRGRMRAMPSPKPGFLSSNRRNMDPDSPARANTSPAAVDYDDVFGGPPRFVTSMLAAQMGPSILPPPSRGVSRTPSYRSSAFPVFDLPVFGDHSSSSGNAFDTHGHDDQQRSSECVPPSSTYGYGRSNISRSKASSRSSSRGASPVHAESSLSQNSVGNNDKPQTTQKNLAAFLKSRSAAGKLSGRNSPSYSFEDTKQRPLEKILRKDAVPTSLPSSPPQPSPWDHMKKIALPKAGYNTVPPNNSDLDDVFGGFPKRVYAQPPKIDTYKAFTPGISTKPHMKKFSVNRSSSGSPEKITTSASSRLNRTVSSPPSSSDDQEFRDEFIEIRMDKNAVSSDSDKLDGATRKPWITVNDLGIGNTQSMQHQPTRPPVVPLSSQLKFKSWKDWTSDPSEDNAGNGHRKDNMFSVDTKKSAYKLSNKQDSNTFSGTLSAESYLSSKPLGKASAIDIVQASEIEESELQALLRNAWKKNEEREKQKKVERTAQMPEKEIHKYYKNQSNLSERQMTSQFNPQDNEQARVHWKELRKHLNKNNDTDKKNTNSSYFSVKKETEFDSKVHMEDEYDVSVLREDAVEPDSKYTEYSQRKSESAVTQGNSTVTVESQVSEKLCNEENLSPPEDVEDLECLDIGSTSFGLQESDTGYQESETLSFERKQTKMERHMRAKERVAKALEEMQQRDAKAQQEQEEKHQLSATTDSHIKRWAAGKEGNLRALLSNLQYVLWQDSGWKPIPLTSLIEGSDVKKAYRKATLFVHPDKLQQKGANLQQKYLAERIFDILQEAWKIFNMQELY